MTPELPPQKNMLNSATLIMGLSGAGKSSLLATFIEYVWETFGLVTLYYCTDGGGFPTQMQALVRAGIGRLWRMRTRSGEGLAFETCQRASQGWWPAAINPVTGEVAPAVRLVPPVTTRFEMRCPNDHVVKVVPSQALLTPAICPTCKTPVNPQNMRVTKSSARTKGFERVGAVCYDGLSSMCGWMMDDLSKRDLGGEKSRLGGVVMSGDLMFGENNRAQVGFTQNRAEQLALNALSIPYLVVPPVWTALVQEGSDEGTMTVVGPMIAGQAKTAVAPQWFGNCLEAIVVEREAKKYRRLNLAEYIDGNNRRHLCKVRSYPGLMPAYLEDEDTGEGGTAHFQNFNLGTFHTLLDRALVTTEQQYQERYPNAPGLTAEEMTYGDETSAAPAAAAASGAPAPAGPRPSGPAQPTRPQPATDPGPAGNGPSAPRPGPRPGGQPGVPGPASPVRQVVTPGPAAPVVGPRVVTPAPPPPVTPVTVTPAAPKPVGPKPPARGPTPPPAGRKPSA